MLARLRRRRRLRRQAAAAFAEIERLAQPPWPGKTPSKTPSPAPGRSELSRQLALLAAVAALAAGAAVALSLPDAGPLAGAPEQLGALAPSGPRSDSSRPQPTAARPAAPRLRPQRGLERPRLIVRGARPQPRGEPLLSARVAALGHYLEHRPCSAAAVRHLLYENAWIVTGAKWGWASGRVALVRLIAVDQRAQERWGLGARSAARAAYALRQLDYMRAHPGARSTDWLESYALGPLPR